MSGLDSVEVEGLRTREPGSALDGFEPTLLPSTFLSHETMQTLTPLTLYIPLT